MDHPAKPTRRFRRAFGERAAFVESDAECENRLVRSVPPGGRGLTIRRAEQIEPSERFLRSVAPQGPDRKIEPVIQNRRRGPTRAYSICTSMKQIETKWPRSARNTRPILMGPG